MTANLKPPSHMAYVIRKPRKYLDSQTWSEVLSTFAGPGIKDNWGAFLNDPAIASRTIPATLAITTVHVGPYDKLEGAYAAVYGWANSNGYESVPPMRDVYTNDPANTPQDQLVTAPGPAF